MRGMFTAGILDVFMENGISFDGAIGVSAGATFGCNLKTGQIGRTLRYNLKYCKDKRYAGLESLIRTGDIYNAKFDYDDIPNRLDPYDTKAHYASPMDFWLTATNVDTGEAVYHKLVDPDIKWIQASASMPGVSNVVYCDGEAYTSSGPDYESDKTFDEKYTQVDCYSMGLSDGGTSDSVPLKFFEDLGYDRIVVICTQPYGYRKKKTSLIPFLKVRLKDYPELVQTLANRHIMYNKTMDYIDRSAAERSDHVLLIRPKEKLKIRKVERNRENIQRVYDMGREEGERRLNDVKKFLGL